MGNRPNLNNYLEDLIGRMSSTENAEPQEEVWDSSKTVSWKAFREAEKLNNEEFVSQLIDYIGAEKDKNKRRNAYFILGHIGRNLADSRVAQFLIDRIEFEKDKYIISSFLDRLADIPKPKGIDLTLLIDATKSEKWLIRQAAIRALNKCDDQLAEKTAIEVSENSADKFDIIYANMVLCSIGTLRALPTLEKHLKSRKPDIKSTARGAVNEILRKNPTAAESQ
jgi:HEAT repeat protein